MIDYSCHLKKYLQLGVVNTQHNVQMMYVHSGTVCLKPV